MNRFFKHFYQNTAWYVIGGLLLAYLSFRVLKPELTIDQMLRDVWAWLHTIFVVSINVITVSAAHDTGTQKGTHSSEFEKANKLNNYIITEYNKEPQKFREFVRMLNDHERKTLQDEFLFSHGVNTFDELDEKEKREYKKLKPLYHDIMGFNLPLYYETTQSGKIDYSASEKGNSGKIKRMIIKGFQGLLFGVITVGVMVQIDEVGAAFLSLAIIGGGMITTYLTTFAPRYHKFSSELPKRVLHKNALWKSFAEKYDELKLKTYEMEKVETSVISDEKTETEQIHAADNETPTTA